MLQTEFLSGIRDSRKAGSLWGMMRGVAGVRKSIHHSWLAKGLGLGLQCWGFKAVQEEIPWGEASTLQSGQWHSHQDNAPVHKSSLSQTIWQDGHQHSSSPPIVQTLLPVTFGYSLSSEAVVMRQLTMWKRLWHAYTRGLPWGLGEVVGTVQQVLCCQRRLLRRGQEFHVCTINKSAHTKKVWKLI